ncbi:MAG: hypothetical protein JXR03_08485 [Cyclobacteriaceae bacterium]
MENLKELNADEMINLNGGVYWWTPYNPAALLDGLLDGFCATSGADGC